MQGSQYILQPRLEGSRRRVAESNSPTGSRGLITGNKEKFSLQIPQVSLHGRDGIMLSDSDDGQRDSDTFSLKDNQVPGTGRIEVD